MSRKQLVVVVALIGLIIVVLSVGRVGPAIGRRLLALHGIPPTEETTPASGGIDGDTASTANGDAGAAPTAPVAGAGRESETGADRSDADESALAQAGRDGWPETPAGVVASGWVRAFSAGEPAMRAFLEAHVSPADLAKRSIPERMKRYRDLRERFGALTLATIDKSTPYRLTATLFAEDASRHQIEFTVVSESPHTLQSVGVYEQVRMGHGSHP